MAGRKRLELTNFDISDLAHHIHKLPFLRKCEERFFEILASRPSIDKMTSADLAVLKKCRYERNAYERRQALLQLILATDSTQRTTVEQKIALLSSQKQIDAYFAMHDMLSMLLRKNRTNLAEKNALKKADDALSPAKDGDVKKSERKKRDHENYFMGAYIKKLLAIAKINEKDNEIQKVTRIFLHIDSENREKYVAIYTEAKNDPRNPFV